MFGTWYSKEPAEIFTSLNSSEHGLSVSEANERLKVQGQNTLPEAKVDGFFVTFLKQFQSSLIYVLLGACALVFILGDVSDGLIILVVLIFNALVGAFQEGRAQNTLRALKKFTETSATVLRDGKELIVSDRDVVEGDIIILQEGEKVPADARVIESVSLKLDESSLTGESEPVSKVEDVIEGDALTPALQRNMVFKGTHIAAGHGRVVVVATGTRTVIGSIAREISSIDSEIPLKRSIRELSHAILVVVALVSVLLILLGLARGETPITIFTTVVSLAVSVIPEGLPIVITLVLATGVWRMSKRNVLVKKLQAVEALGQARVIAVDKTGTLTRNELVVREVWTDGKTFHIGGVGYDPVGNVHLGTALVDAANHHELLRMGKMASLGATAHVSYLEVEKRWKVTGDPTEAALKILGQKTGYSKEDLMHESQLVSEIPFDYRLKYHASVYAEGGTNQLIVQGAPEEILDACTHLERDSVRQPLGKRERDELEAIHAQMSLRGLRVLACAFHDHAPTVIAPKDVRGLVFAGFYGMQDTLRPEVASAMERAQAAGIKVVMITGDHKLTAQAIAREAGIWKEGDAVLTGEDIDHMTEAELARELGNVSVFARVTPEHKLEIVNAYKKRKEIIAMTGDGVNDAPPLVAADLGIAMGKIGTEVAKEASDIILLDDNFGSIISAIEEGRSIFKSIKKVILYLFSTSLGEVLVITAALLLGYPLPILAAQIIWLNFVTDGFLTVALAMEPKETGLLRDTRARSKALVDRPLFLHMFLMALPMLFGTMYLFHQYYEFDLPKALTISLTTLAIFQWFNAWNCRSQRDSIFSSNPFSNPYLIGATLLVIALQVFAVYHPFMQSLLHTVPLELSEWVMIIPIALTIVAVEEVRKYIARNATWT